MIEFPGRRFKIIESLPYNKKELKKRLPTNKANITTRNFPETVAQIRKNTESKMVEISICFLQQIVITNTSFYFVKRIKVNTIFI